MRPGALGVHVVDGQGGDPAPVVGARAHEQVELRRIREVRRHLDPHARAHDEPRHRDRGDILEQIGVRHSLHRGAGLRAEVLHDHLLHVTLPVAGGRAVDHVPLVRVADRDQRRCTVARRFADADQDAGGEGHALSPRGVDHGEPHGRVLVGRAEMHLPGFLEQPARGRLEHHAHRRGGGPQHPQLFRAHDARVGVRQQPGLGRHQARDVRDVLDRRCEPVLVEPCARFGPAVLGPVSQGQQHLFAAHRLALPHDSEHLFGRHVRGLVLLEQLPRRVDEHAVVAAVAAERGQRHEHLARVRDHAGTTGCREPGIPQLAGDREQAFETLALRGEQRLGVGRIEPLAGSGARERCVDGGRRGGCRGRGDGGGRDGHRSSLAPSRGAGVADRCPPVSK